MNVFQPTSYHGTRVGKTEPLPKLFARLLVNNRTGRIACLPSLSRTSAVTASGTSESPEKLQRSNVKSTARQKAIMTPRPSGATKVSAPATQVRACTHLHIIPYAGESFVSWPDFLPGGTSVMVRTVGQLVRHAKA